MMFYYLIKEYRGAASKKIYGKINDKVAIIQRKGNLVLVVNEKDEKYYIKPEYLSSTPIKK